MLVNMALNQTRLSKKRDPLCGRQSPECARLYGGDCGPIEVQEAAA